MVDADGRERLTSHWSAAAVATIAGAPVPAAPVFARPAPLLPGYHLWDYWPVQEADGRVARIGNGTLYVFLAAPAGDPDERHARAALRFIHHGAGGWRDLGPLFAAGFAPGSRQWSGSTVIDPAHTKLTLYFTAAGRRDEAVPGFDQRLFVSEVAIVGATIGAWSRPRELVAPASPYAADMHGGGAIGTIKAFRDPYFFRDPGDGAEYLLFTASLAASASPWNGIVGVAQRSADGWVAAPPLISADGVNNELERPHVIVRDGRYYCFWSTQAKVFAPGLAAPTGLYGMVADRFAGPWRPLNGSGLVIANPAAAPHQAYSWLVLADLRTISFADFPMIDDGLLAHDRFAGTPAPDLHLNLSGDRAKLVPSPAA